LKLLVVAAWEPELARLRARIADRRPQRPELVLETVGVGLVEASIAMTRCIEAHRPTAALFLGTCGVFLDATHATASSPALEVLAVVTAARAELVDASAVEGKAALPGPMPARATFDDRLRSALVQAGARSVHVANTVAITTDDALAARLACDGAHQVEHLEAFAFARACAVASVPSAAALAVANVVGARGRAEWLANHLQASATVADLVFDALPALADVRF
jgi:nucleoside phosphorylase